MVSKTLKIKTLKLALASLLSFGTLAFGEGSQALENNINGLKFMVGGAVGTDASATKSSQGVTFNNLVATTCPSIKT
ncbi:hypothetical protein [Helicobacter sp. 11S02629-2]|uniref:hypothetical protein n=1 Tax=Helicobacter sp. 11S02629-2 TaxID=1476195 RepID=UPI000BA72310|nr:hypothetical protein [Helicobacter sp. 11S02629-2]PAF45620.1 hypothetical protein BKH40_01700 [Helicobacter sp. 11S02629-2]